MAYLISDFYHSYRDLIDPRVGHWPMMSSPFPTVANCLCYFLFCKRIGPRLMENRKPFDLRQILIYYNLAQTVFSAWIFYEVSVIYLLIFSMVPNS